MSADPDRAEDARLDAVVQVMAEVGYAPDELAKLLRKLAFSPQDMARLRWTTKRRCKRRTRRRPNGNG